MRTRPSLTQAAHSFLAPALQPGAWVVDATCGNGHDSLHMAQRVFAASAAMGPGHLAVFDAQAAATTATTQHLQQGGFSAQLSTGHITVHTTGHQHMFTTLGSAWMGKAAAVCFNLGYLPGSCKTHTTAGATTLPALAASLQLLASAGRLSVLAYRGHTGGPAEYAAVSAWFAAQQAAGTLSYQTQTGPHPQSPVLFMGVKG